VVITPPEEASLEEDKCDELQAMIDTSFNAAYAGFDSRTGKVGAYQCKKATASEYRVCFSMFSVDSADELRIAVDTTEIYKRLALVVFPLECDMAVVIEFSCGTDIGGSLGCALATPFPYCTCERNVPSPFYLSKQYEVVVLSTKQDALCWTVKYDDEAAKPGTGKCGAKFGLAKKIEFSMAIAPPSRVSKFAYAIVAGKRRALTAEFAKDVAGTTVMDSYKITTSGGLKISKDMVKKGYKVCIPVAKGLRFKDLAATTSPNGIDPATPEQVGFYTIFDYTHKCCYNKNYYYP
jgi:hypothetical protein